MSVGLLLTTFGVVLLAGLGDKAELTTMFLSARAPSPVPIFLGSSVALVVSALLGTLFGTALQRLISPTLLHVGSALAFIAIGGAMLLRH